MTPPSPSPAAKRIAETIRAPKSTSSSMQGTSRWIQNRKRSSGSRRRFWINNRSDRGPLLPTGGDYRRIVARP
jgi:hypothetical protein